jgi:hypothetical protein
MEMDTALLADELGAVVRAFNDRYHDLDNASASRRPGEGSWSAKEIIGHLIDSASNNHQRFVRLQIQERLIFPDYGKDNLRWVAIEHFNEMGFSDLLAFWMLYNVLIENIIRTADPAKLQNYWDRGDSKTTLLDLMKDYLRHLKEHTASFQRTVEEPGT